MLYSLRNYRGNMDSLAAVVRRIAYLIPHKRYAVYNIRSLRLLVGIESEIGTKG